MATQAALIADTIVGMKRALRRERDDSGPDDAIIQPTNRGNKMRANAKYVREGALGYINAEYFYKEEIDHAGYTRHILQRNPIRYDSEGDELDEEDEDSEADAAAAEENPFSGIALETLLCPLKHPSELPNHPSLSQPYTSQALEQMTIAVEDKLRQEKALLWRARNLHRQFLGDGGWMPCGIMESLDDRYIFEPRIAGDKTNASAGQQRQPGPRFASDDLNAPQEIPSATISLKDGQPAPNATESDFQTGGGDVHMAEVPVASGETTASHDAQETIKEFKSEETDATVKDLPQHPAEVSASGSESNIAPVQNGPTEKQEMDTSKDGENTDHNITHPDQHETNEDDNDQDAEMRDGSSPEPPSPSLSADTTSSLPTPHPLFLIPNNIRPNANFGLPPTEAEETRRLLWSYIQKQEETVRGFEHMLDSLFRACHMKADVLEWCKAEGHVGELSDGEDWYDRERWGLGEGEDLKKGTDEDEVETVDESRTTAKRGRGRRQ
ncbi:uncharacterized protein N7482_007588 [Penicillium canariense]|uniref:Transcriptional regulatory protein RXT2 N-terminal domain-containing protein n=1 Tax=Penicillium canariense TaxID=189055 RepID=A0A9W9HYE9_9EURO|nr:uncharacterized protein N7482_007588 [Penicillium canariense]KAJ5160584.1 hypothetical protein N7482_007588 [Penicillium canariense]